MKKETILQVLRKTGAALLAACLLAGTVVPENVYASGITYDTDGTGYGEDTSMFVYRIPTTATTTSGAQVYGYLGTKTAITLPTRCESYKVTEVSGDFSTYSIATKFTSIKIPSGYTTIEKNAFSNQTKLYRVQIPSSVKKIAATAFTGCDLTKLTIVAPYGSYAEEFANENGINYTNSTSVKLQTAGTTMYVGESRSIALLNNSKSVKWSSSSSSVATISGNGTVKAKKAGTTTITATVGTKTYSKKFKVLKRTEKNVLKVIWACYVKPTMSDYEKAVAASAWLKENVSTSGTSVDAKKAFVSGKVNYTGYANAYKKILDHYGMTVEVISGTSHMDNSVVIAGKTYTASTLSSASGVDKTYTTTLCEGVALNKSTMTISVGKSDSFQTLGITKAITWTSSNTKVATVDSKGKVTGVKAGTATITMKMDGKTQKCTVRVNS